MFSGCIPTQEYPITPKIEFSNVYFVDSNTDSLVVTLQFQDGDGDLGLSNNQNSYPFHQYNFYHAETGEELNAMAARTQRNIDVSQAIHYSHKRTGAIDTLPPFSAPGTCPSYQYPKEKNPLIINGVEHNDTIYFQRNPNHYNIFVTFLLRNPNGQFTEYNWGCGENYHGRFPVMVDDDKEKAIEGTLTYKIQGAVLGDILERKIIKLRIYIQDRALHKSNVVETQEFILSEITK
jgi:hypothetical protein